MLQIILIALSLSIDTLAVTICGSMSLGKINFGKVTRTAMMFGLIQTLFIFIGWSIGYGVSFFVDNFAPYIAFALLLYIGLSMIIKAIKNIVNSRKSKGGSSEDAGVNLGAIGSLILAGVATSIDALSVGASMALCGVEELLQMGINCAVVFVITAAVAVIGITSGKWIGSKFGNWASIIGGLVLIAIGVNIAFF
ncbi:MAG: manganese efflux pump [Bacteroidales bacterium]|nr:manganese efflux pump [Bacteroidales bacterium]